MCAPFCLFAPKKNAALRVTESSALFHSYYIS